MGKKSKGDNTENSLTRDKDEQIAIKRIDDSINELREVYVTRTHHIVDLVEVEVQAFKMRTDFNVGQFDIALIPYINYLYAQACYRILKAYDFGSPSLIGILSGIWSVLTIIYEAVKWFVEFIHLREILDVAEILSAVWPAFRKKMNIVWSKVSEASEKIGWGVDGLMHLIQATQGGVDLIGGVLGKDRSWGRIKEADRALFALQVISHSGKMIEEDPGQLMDVIFAGGSYADQVEMGNWWKGVDEFINKWVDTAKDTVEKVNGVVDDLNRIEYMLPDFVRDNIPDVIWDSIDFVDRVIDDTVLPAIRQFEDTFSEIEGVLNQYREHADEIVEELNRPGDLMLRIDALSDISRKIQEEKIDDAASRKYERDTEAYEHEDRAIMEEFERIDRLMSAPIPPPRFLQIESKGYQPAGPPVGEKRTTWFVGDY